MAQVCNASLLVSSLDATHLQEPVWRGSLKWYRKLQTYLVHLSQGESKGGHKVQAVPSIGWKLFFEVLRHGFRHDPPFFFAGEGIQWYFRCSKFVHVQLFLLLRLVALASTLVVAMASTLVVAMASTLVVAMASTLVAIASTPVAMASTLVAMAFNLIAMASNLIAMASNLKAMASNLLAS